MAAIVVWLWTIGPIRTICPKWSDFWRIAPIWRKQFNFKFFKYMKWVKTEFLSSKLVRFSKQISNVNILALLNDNPSKFLLRGRPEYQLLTFLFPKNWTWFTWSDFWSEFWWFGAIFRTKMANFRPKILKFSNGRDVHETKRLSINTDTK